MTSEGAFGGDPGLKADVLARIDRHLAAGTMTFEETAWTGSGGSPMGVSIESSDPAAYAAAYGYPLSLTMLLDTLSAYPRAPFDAPGFARAWIDVVEPGADLTRVPAELMLFMLADPRLDEVDAEITAALVALHRRDLGDSPATRAEWSFMRQTIVASASDSPDNHRRLAQRMWEAAAWPAARGQSTLTSAFAGWRQLQSLFHDPHWSAADEARKDAMLHTIWVEQTVARDADEMVDYPGILHARDNDLSDRYASNMTRTNARILAATATLADRCIDLLRAAKPVGVPRLDDARGG